jgi:hypothetical protein
VKAPGEETPGAFFHATAELGDRCGGPFEYEAGIRGGAEEEVGGLREKAHRKKTQGVKAFVNQPVIRS